MYKMISTHHGFFLIFVTNLILIFNYGDMAVPSKRIHGGEPVVTLGEIPYIVSIRINGKHYCGGAIISEKYILTSAIDVYQFKPPYNNILVVSGTISLSHGGESHEISAIVVHPRFFERVYQNAVRYDVSVLMLSKPMIFNLNQQSIKLATTEIRDGEKALFSGWGDTNETKTLSDTLRKVILTAYSAPTCVLKDGAPLDDASRICTIDEKGKGSCDFDTGNPLVANEELIGIASGIRWDIGCASGRMEFYVYIFECLDFILGAMDQETRTKMYFERKK